MGDNDLTGGEFKYFWRRKSYQVNTLAKAMIAAYPGYQGLATMPTRMLLTGVNRPDLVFAREAGPVANHAIVADNPNIEEDFL